MLDRPLYHCNSTTLAAGSIIEPGNWGRILNLYQRLSYQEPANGNVHNEVMLDLARMLYAPQKPSRLSSNFLCPTLDGLAAYRNGFASFSLIYEVELTQPESPFHLGDHALAIQAPLGPQLALLQSRNRAYWIEDHSASPNQEIAVSSPLRVLRRIG
jgi:hypothetical protein